MDRQLPRLPRWSPNQAKRRLQASRALRFEASRWRWTRTRTGRRWLVGAGAVSLAAFMTGPWLLEGLARRDPDGPAAVLLVLAGLLVSWPVWVLSQLGLWFLLDQATGLTPASWTSASRWCATAPTAAPTGSSRSPWPASWSPPGPGPGRSPSPATAGRWC